MTLEVTALYEALKAAGVEDSLAHRAAEAVLGVEDRAQLGTKADLTALQLVTKPDLTELQRAMKADLAEFRVGLAEMKVDLLKWTVGLSIGTLVAMTALFTTLVKWLVGP